ncbi:KIF1-binding protein homolog [Orussus abietinus]|uniref:KIF1-binding protein homolog n=1 Tax=Orussus abietinus TaxID=222816 RepID=UPI00062547AD|nr:KIF1-binding protein homolog [Orussus abietinus]
MGSLDLEEIKQKYAEVRRLLDEKSTLDSKNEPYKSKYAAIDILNEMQTRLSALLNSDLTEEQRDLILPMLSTVWLDLSVTSIATEELSVGEKYLMNCLNILKGKENRPDTILQMLGVLNELGVLWSTRNEPEKAKEFFERAEQIYNDYSKDENYRPPIGMAEIFDVSTDDLSSTKMLQKLHTLTIYYLAQVYGMLNEHLKSAVYCHTTLCHQLESDDLDYVDWALNAATLSQFFIERNCFHQGRHHLAAASYMLSEYKKKLANSAGKSEEESKAQEENFKHRSADVARCWAKYGILLLSMSRDNLMQKAESESDIDENQTSDENTDCLKDLKFSSLEKNLEFISSQITDKYVLDFNDARAVFLNVQKWLDEAKEYYSLEDHASDHVQIIQDMSLAYKHLAFFEESEDRQAKMHKRRLDILENLVEQLNPQYYQSACRQIWIEIGDIYSAILDIKLDRLRATDHPAPAAINKVNHLAKSAIMYFQKFIDSLVDFDVSDSKKFPDNLVHLGLYSYFYVGILYSKIITPDKRMQLDNINHSYKAYKFVADYCNQHPSAIELVKTEYSVCKDIVELLPIKINKLKQEVDG